MYRGGLRLSSNLWPGQSGIKKEYCRGGHALGVLAARKIGNHAGLPLQFAQQFFLNGLEPLFLDQLPLAVPVLLYQSNVVLGQMPEPSLGFEILLDGLQGFRDYVHLHLPVFILGQVPHSGLHRQLPDLHREVGGESPSGGAGAHDVDELGTLDILNLLHLVHEIVRIGRTRRGGIGNPVSDHDLE